MENKDINRLRELRDKLLMSINDLTPIEREEYDTLLNMSKQMEQNDTIKI